MTLHPGSAEDLQTPLKEILHSQDVPFGLSKTPAAEPARQAKRAEQIRHDGRYGLL